MQRFLLISGIFVVSLIACLKHSRDAGTSLVDMDFTFTNSPSSVTTGQDIISRVKCYGYDLCFRFSKFEIIENSPRQFDIRAKATYPNGEVDCPLALYQLDSTVRIKTKSSGEYLLRFYNRNELFKIDTVQVN